MSNVAIRVGETWLELPSNFVFSQTKKTPLYLGQSINFIPGNYTLPVNIDASPANRTALGYRDFVDNPNTFSANIPADVYLFGNFYESGRLIAQSADSREFRIQFMSGTGELAAFGDKSIRDFDLGAISETGTSVQNITDIVYGQWADSQENPQDYPYLSYKFYYPYPLPALPDYRYHTNTINMYVKDVLKGVCEGEGFSFIGDVFNFYFESRYILFFPRDFRIRRFVHETGAFDYHLDLNTCVPDITVSTFISNLAKTFCWCFYVNSHLRTIRVFRQSDIVIAQGVDRSARVAGDFTRSESALQIKRLSYTFTNTESANHDGAKNLASYNYLGTVVNISDLPTDDMQEGNLMFVFQLMSYVPYSEFLEDEDGNLSAGWDLEKKFQDLEGINVDRSGSSIESKCGAVYVHCDDERDGFDLQTDVAPYFGEQILYNDTVEPAEDFAVCCYYGKYQFRDSSAKRPLVSYYGYSTDGQPFGSHSLKWRGNDGLYALNWKPWIDFINDSDAVEVDMLWQENDLNDPDVFLKPMYLFDAHSGTTQKFLMKEMKIVVGINDGLRVSKQKLIQIRHEVSRGK